MIETGQKHFVLHKYEDFVPIIEWVASCDCIVEKIGLRGWEKCYGKNKPVSSILHKDLFLGGLKKRQKSIRLGMWWIPLVNA